MPRSAGSRSTGIAVPDRKPRAWMPAILRDVPSGHKWGWYSREDQRMHLQSVDGKYKYKV